MVFVASKVGERGQIFTILRRIVVLRNEESGKFGPLSHRRSRIIHNPTASSVLGFASE
jgi:hypothetical protein